MKYTLQDPRPIHAENPYSFYTPCQARLDALAKGDSVKALFMPEDEDDPTERMWVVIDEIADGHIKGRLANDPMFATGTSHGDPIEMEAWHVIDIETERNDDPPETNDNGRFFARCLVDARIDGGAPIARIVRDQDPPVDFHGKGMFPWSGWRFEADGYEAGMAVETYALIVPMRRELGYEDLLGSPPGSVIIRDGAGGWRLDAPLH